MILLFRLLLSFNATSLLIIIFLVKKGYSIDYFLPAHPIINATPSILSYLLYAAIPVALTWLSINLTPLLGSDDFKENHIIEVECADNIFLPSYLGYFFVALSIDHWGTLTFIYSILFIFTFLSQALYFNPIFLAFKYGFYNIKTRNGAAIFLISKNSFKTPSEVEIPRAYRINNYTYIDGS